MGCDRGSNPGVGLVQDGQRLPSQLFNLSGVPPKSTLRGGVSILSYPEKASSLPTRGPKVNPGSQIPGPNPRGFQVCKAVRGAPGERVGTPDSQPACVACSEDNARSMDDGARLSPHPKTRPTGGHPSQDLRLLKSRGAIARRPPLPPERPKPGERLQSWDPAGPVRRAQRGRAGNRSADIGAGAWRGAPGVGPGPEKRPAARAEPWTGRIRSPSGGRRRSRSRGLDLPVRPSVRPRRPRRRDPGLPPPPGPHRLVQLHADLEGLLLQRFERDGDGHGGARATRRPRDPHNMQLTPPPS